MDAHDKFDKSRLAINRLNLNSARLVYCERFNEKNFPLNTVGEINEEGANKEYKFQRCTSWNFSKHSHDFLELIYFIDGQANIKGEKAEYMASPFDIILYPQGVEHQELLNIYKHQEIICMGVKFSNSSNIETILSIKDHNNKLNWIFKEIYSQHNLKENRNGEQVFTLVKLMFFYIQQILEENTNSSMNRMEQAIFYIRENFVHPITIEELADFVNISPTFLNKLFKKMTGSTPINYVNQVRIDMAKKLLLAPDTTVRIMCEKVGIDDPKYFSRLFKKIEGMTPSEYISKNKHKLSVRK